MFEYFLLAGAIIGLGIASYYDLRTTEVPDIIFVLMATFGISFHFTRSLISGNWIFFLGSMAFGTLLLAFGFLRYYWREWGGADALMLGAIGYLLPYWPNPNSALPFPIVFTINLFIIGAIYAIIYAVIISLKKPEIYAELFRRLKNSWREIICLSLFYIFVSIVIMSLYKNSIFHNLLFTFYFMLLSIYVLFVFLRTVDEKGMRRKVKSTELREGDVLSKRIELSGKKLGGRIEGLSNEEIKIIRKNLKEVEIIDGVRYIPSFLITLLFTIHYGNIFQILLNF